MSILVDKNSKVVVQGITGSEGQFHSNQMLDYGTNIVAGVTPGKGGQYTLDNSIPIFNLVEEAVKETGADTSIIFVPPPFAADASQHAAEEPPGDAVAPPQNTPRAPAAAPAPPCPGKAMAQTPVGCNVHN